LIVNEARTPVYVSADSVLFEALLSSVVATLGEKKGHRLLREMTEMLAQAKATQNVTTIRTAPAEHEARVAAIGDAVAAYNGMLPRLVSRLF
jgi:hypothetical protein